MFLVVLWLLQEKCAHPTPNGTPGLLWRCIPRGLILNTKPYIPSTIQHVLCASYHVLYTRYHALYSIYYILYIIYYILHIMSYVLYTTCTYMSKRTSKTHCKADPSQPKVTAVMVNSSLDQATQVPWLSLMPQGLR